MKRIRVGLAVGCTAVAVMLAVGCTELPEGATPSEAVSSDEVSLVSSETPSRPSEISLPPEESTDVSVPTESSEPEGFYAYRAPGEVRLEELRLPGIPEQGFSLLQTRLTLAVGRSYVLQYEFKPLGVTERTLQWSSSDPSVLTVENGRLTAVQTGKATVTAVTAGGRQAQCQVTVTAQEPLSPLASLLERITDGNPNGWQFALYDCKRDGTAYLLARHIGEGGIPTVGVYDRTEGTELLSFATGENEEWALWKRSDGEIYALLSYTRVTESGGTLSVMEELDREEALVLRRVLARDTDGNCYIWQEGQSISCDASTYQSRKQAYFASNRELPETAPDWKSGTDVQKIAQQLH